MRLSTWATAHCRLCVASAAPAPIVALRKLRRDSMGWSSLMRTHMLHHWEHGRLAGWVTAAETTPGINTPGFSWRLFLKLFRHPAIGCQESGRSPAVESFRSEFVRRRHANQQTWPHGIGAWFRDGDWGRLMEREPPPVVVREWS